MRVEGLKVITCEKFDRQLQQHWISDTFPDCIREVYLTTNDVDSKSTRNSVVSAVALHNEGLIHKGPFQDLIREVGDFAVDLVLKMAENSSKRG